MHRVAVVLRHGLLKVLRGGVMSKFYLAAFGPYLLLDGHFIIGPILIFIAILQLLEVE